VPFVVLDVSVQSVTRHVEHYVAPTTLGALCGSPGPRVEALCISCWMTDNAPVGPTGRNKTRVLVSDSLQPAPESPAHPEHSENVGDLDLLTDDLDVDRQRRIRRVGTSIGRIPCVRRQALDRQPRRSQAVELVVAHAADVILSSRVIDFPPG